MNTKKYLIGSIAVFVTMFILEYVLHEVLLKEQYLAHQHIFRPEEAMMTYFPAMIVAYLMISFGFCYIFTKGYEGKGIMEGVRYGLLIGFAFVVPQALINYSVYPLSGWIMLTTFFGFPITSMAMGAVIAGIYKPK